MALPTFAKAREWFEEYFDEVHVYDPKTHPASLSPRLTPNGREYFIVVNGELRNEGEPGPPAAESEGQAASLWFDAVLTLYRLMGKPKFLWWRTVPEYNEGRIYSRFLMTKTGPYQSYRGRPAAKFKANENG